RRRAEARGGDAGHRGRGGSDRLAGLGRVRTRPADAAPPRGDAGARGPGALSAVPFPGPVHADRSRAGHFLRGDARAVHLSMLLQLTELWNLQQIDSDIHRLKRERGRLDEGAALRQAWQAAVKAVEALEARLRKLRADLADAELELKKIEGKKADFERRQL